MQSIQTRDGGCVYNLRYITMLYYYLRQHKKMKMKMRIL